jgi:catechol 2,3-dioxygenase-like lactoylglutathione lyase family enzyme
MLGSAKIVAFAPTRDAEKAQKFYEGVLGLKLVSKDKFALEFDANGTMLRVASVPKYEPHPFTILGWGVRDIAKTVKAMSAKGVEFQQYGMPGQGESGIWTSPSGAKVAWFKDPDGNVLSVTQFE